MDPKKVTEALDALIAGDAEKCMDLLKGIVAAAAGGEPPPGDPPADPPVDDALSGIAPAEKKEEVVAASARLMRLSGAKSFVAAVEEVAVWRESHLKLEAETQKLASERATLESAERRKLCAELVTLGAEFPSTVWADDKSTALKPRWLKSESGELRAHAAEQRAARGKAPPTPPIVPPTGDGAGTLSPRELALCASKKLDPAAYAVVKNQMGKS